MQERDVDKELGQLIAAFRRLRKPACSQAELARLMSERLGKSVDPTTITRIEGGKRPVTVAELVMLAEIFEMPFEYLMPTTKPIETGWRYWRERAEKSEDAVAALEVDLGRAQEEKARADQMSNAMASLRNYQANKLKWTVPEALQVAARLHHGAGNIKFRDIVGDLDVPTDVLSAALKYADEKMLDHREGDEETHTAMHLAKYLIHHYFQHEDDGYPAP